MKNYNLKTTGVQFRLSENDFAHSSENFGREKELRKLRQWVFNDQRSVILITGKVATGKTSLGRQFVAELGNFRVEWIDASVDTDLDVKIGNILLTLRLEEGIPASSIIIIDNIEVLSGETLQRHVEKILNFKRVRAVILIGNKSLENIRGLKKISLKRLRPSIDSLSDHDDDYHHDDYHEHDTPHDEQIEYQSKKTLHEYESSLIRVARPKIILLTNNLIEKLRKSPLDIYQLGPRKFEEVIADLLTDQGCDVEITQETRDGGKDIIASMDTPIGRVLTLVETKRYKYSRPIRIGLIRELYGVLNDHRASHAMMVTSSRFTRDAREFQSRHEYELSLKEYKDIEGWIRKYRRS